MTDKHVWTGWYLARVPAWDMAGALKDAREQAAVDHPDTSPDAMQIPMIRDIEGVGIRVMVGDWRRRRGTKTDAHLYRPPYDLPSCNKRVPLSATTRVEKGRPCTDCLVAEITRR